ncbi:hypothetical protein [Pelosinus sp. IPA-1]|uniref:hypothetical protein n=1 Tax=Pelosinus sp. IPA-1 TaxID=3029569 RepID=UPI0024362223|nr:hypothetical protein [Pelosinus sp. IPA-1]GMB01002.1 hypothetical protein PIPA1_38010 [Pelosinus sp. IPA-1]
MFKTYRTINETIMGEEAESDDITLTLITDVDGNEYVMVKTQEEKAIYNLSLIGYVTEIVQDASFEEFRKIIYARLDKLRHH